MTQTKLDELRVNYKKMSKEENAMAVFTSNEFRMMILAVSAKDNNGLITIINGLGVMESDNVIELLERLTVENVSAMEENASFLGLILKFYAAFPELDQPEKLTDAELKALIAGFKVQQKTHQWATVEEMADTEDIVHWNETEEVEAEEVIESETEAVVEDETVEEEVVEPVKPKAKEPKPEVKAKEPKAKEVVVKGLSNDYMQ